MAKPLFTMSDAEIRDAATRNAEHVQFAYNDYLAELDRRSNRRLTIAIAGSAMAYTVITLALLVITAVRQ